MKAFRALFAISVAVNTVFAQTYRKYSADLVGSYHLPLIDHDRLPATCRDFSAACKAEEEQRYSDAISIYESKYPECGDVGWVLEGNAHGAMYRCDTGSRLQGCCVLVTVTESDRQPCA